MNKKKEAEKLIREKAEWLKELSFGCEVGKAGTFYIGCSDDYSEHWFYRPDQIQGGQDDIFYTEDVDVEHLKSTIIGRPITICDVLRVLYVVKKERVFFVAGDGYLLEITDVGRYKPTGVYLKLTKQFDNQPDEFYAFIVELLGNE